MNHPKKRAVLCGAAASLSLAAFAPTAHAAFAYAFGEQTVNNVAVSGAGIGGTTLVATGNTAASVTDGTGISTNAPTDTPEAYLGAPPPAPQNDFVKYSTAGGGPQAGDFVRGDAALNSVGNLFSSGANTSAVAESFVSNPGDFDSSVANWQLSGSFTDTGTSVNVSYNWANDIITQVSGSGSTAQASFAGSITIKDQHGHQVKADPTDLNSALSSPPNGPEIITSGSGSATLSLAGLTAGDTFSINIVGTTNTITQVAAVPEPSTALLGIGAFAGLALRRRRAR